MNALTELLEEIEEQLRPQAFTPTTVITTEQEKVRAQRLLQSAMSDFHALAATINGKKSV